jgi:hypothetical protein
MEEERSALEEEIRKLQDLFVGMEYFGSDPSKPARYCADLVADCDLYVGIFGNRYGSVDAESNKSFTEVEYDTARRKGIPCLVYFKVASSSTGNSKNQDANLDNSRQVDLNARLRNDHVVYSFATSHELQLQFLIDFIKLLRAGLFQKSGVSQQGVISALALHSLTRGLIREQIKEVSQDKYIREIYVPRQAEESINRFVDFEETFSVRATAILLSLGSISQRYGFKESAASALDLATLAVARSHDHSALLQSITQLKDAFFFDEVESCVGFMAILLKEKSEHMLDAGIRELSSKLGIAPFTLKEEVSGLQEILRNLWASAKTGQNPLDSLMYKSALRIFPSEKVKERVYLANDLLKEFDGLVNESAKRCAVLVDKAGSGKTNVICRLAERIAEHHAVMLLSGQMEISTEYDVEFHIQRRLESELGGLLSDWINRAAPGLESSRKWLFVIIDGINENANLQLLIRLLTRLLARTEGKRIKLLLSCRDLFWDLFAPHLKTHLFGAGVIPLGQFTEAEWRKAMALYFQRFKVEAAVSDQASLALRNPLLLRFFCEAYQGRTLGQVSDLRLLSVFDLYLQRAVHNIAQRFGLLNDQSPVLFLLSIVCRMWDRRATSVAGADIGLSPEDSSASSSLYNAVLSENLILEEATQRYSTRKVVRFRYDEFMEYILARSWVEQVQSSKTPEAATEQLLQEAGDAVVGFPAALGGILFLDQMLNRGGRLVAQAFILSGPQQDVFLNSRQRALLYALENIDTTVVPESLIGLVDKFEKVVSLELKERLGQVVLRILKSRPSDPLLGGLVRRMLEIELPPVSGTPAATDVVQPQPLRQKLLKGLKAIAPAKNAAPATRKTGSATADEKKEVPRLPPARYHYTEETKLNAIALLITSRDASGLDVVEQGIRHLGRMDVHSALQALEAVDLAEDEFVFKTIDQYVRAPICEYQIYCAWLLRDRYGARPARFLLRLLSAREARVHRYTFRLFDRRRVEKELLEAVLAELAKGWKDTRTWHLGYRARLLGMTQQFDPAGLLNSLGPAIVERLAELCRHPQASIRLEAFRAILKYPNLINVSDITHKLEEDKDIYVRGLLLRLRKPN